MTDQSPTTASSSESPSRNLDTTRRGILQTDHGATRISDAVVTKVAGIAAREISGVHAMGSGTARTFGSLRERIPVGSSSPSVSQGVAVEVGERQAAIDLDIVVEYGVSIVDVTNAVRQNVTKRVEGMTGLEVTEVNIIVDDIWLGDDEQDNDPRVS